MNKLILFRSFATKLSFLEQLSTVQLLPSISSSHFRELCKRAIQEQQISSAHLLKLKKLFIRLKWSSVTYTEFISVLATHMPLTNHQLILQKQLIAFFKTQLSFLNVQSLVQTRLFVAKYLTENKQLSTALRSAVLRSLKIMPAEVLINLLWETKFHDQITDVKYIEELLSASRQIPPPDSFQLLFKLTTSLVEIKGKIQSESINKASNQLAQISLYSFQLLLSQLTLEQIHSLIQGYAELEVMLTPQILTQLQEILIDARRIVSVNGKATQLIDSDLLKLHRCLLSSQKCDYDLPKFRDMTLTKIYKQRQSSEGEFEFKQNSPEDLFSKLMSNSLDFEQNYSLVQHFPLQRVNYNVLVKVIRSKIEAILKNEKELVLFREIDELRQVGILGSELSSQIKEIMNQQLYLQIDEIPLSLILNYLVTPDNCQYYFEFDVILAMRERVLDEQDKIPQVLRSRLLLLGARCRDPLLLNEEEWSEIKNLLQI